MFHNVAEKYDLMNDAMSWGIHRLWKDYFVQQLCPTHQMKVLDLAGGTGQWVFGNVHYELIFLCFIQCLVYTFTLSFPGDVAIRIAQFVKNLRPLPDDADPAQMIESQIVVCDINKAMLNVGERKAESIGLANEITWKEGNAEDIPFDSSSFDACTIAFGIRNCTHIEKVHYISPLLEILAFLLRIEMLIGILNFNVYQVLQEAYRVLKPGGRFMCLEFSHVKNSLLQW